METAIFSINVFTKILFAATRLFVLVFAFHGKTDRSVCDQRSYIAGKAEIKSDIHHIDDRQDQCHYIKSQYYIEKYPCFIFPKILPKDKDQKIYSFKSIKNTNGDH